MKFQVTENYGNGSFGYLYIDSEPIGEKVCNLAIQAVKKSYKENSQLAWFGVKPPNPLLKISEYNEAKKKVVRGGVKFQTRWR